MAEAIRKLGFGSSDRAFSPTLRQSITIQLTFTATKRCNTDANRSVERVVVANASGLAPALPALAARQIPFVRPSYRPFNYGPSVLMGVPIVAGANSGVR